jgi:hypothetical protein
MTKGRAVAGLWFVYGDGKQQVPPLRYGRDDTFVLVGQYFQEMFLAVYQGQARIVLFPGGA